jgi:hypothetical protein
MTDEKCQIEKYPQIFLAKTSPENNHNIAIVTNTPLPVSYGDNIKLRK